MKNHLLILFSILRNTTDKEDNKMSEKKVTMKAGIPLDDDKLEIVSGGGKGNEE